MLSNTNQINSITNYQDVNVESTLISSPNLNTNETTTTTTDSTTTNTNKPFKMNTYIQLDIDQNNFNCLPRICKFLITKLKLDQELQSSVILAVKLEVSKRSLRTLEIPLINQQKADLNLSYNITYPHYLKKDSNLLYFYIQTRRKKYKTKSKTIQFGFKTLAYTFIDLANALQKPFSNDLPLFLRSKGQSSKQIIGYLTIQSLTSQPIQDFDTANEQDLESYELNSEVDSDTDLQQQHQRPTPRLSSSKSSSGKNQLTGKIISFIRKLKNENNSSIKNTRVVNEENENENENSLIINEDFDDLGLIEEDEDLDDDFYANIEQVSDYVNSDSDEQNSNFLLKDQDAYSIVSTPKPKIEPFFTQSYLDILNTNRYSSDQSLRLDLKFTNCSSSSCTSNELKFLLVEDLDLNLNLTNDKDDLIRTNLDELTANLNESLLMQFLKNKKLFCIVLVGSNSFLNKYLQLVYLNLLKKNQDFSKLFKHYFIAKTSSLLGSYLCNLSSKYKSLFETNENSDLESRIGKYLNSSSREMVSLQIGEVMLNFENEISNEKFVPFLIDVRIGFNNRTDTYEDESSSCGSSQVQQRASLSTSSSLPQFLSQNQTNNQLIANQQLIKNVRYSPPSSPQQANLDNDLGCFYNLQLDYWINQSTGILGVNPTIISNTQNLISNMNLNGLNDSPMSMSNISAGGGSSSSSQLQNKSTIKALFKNLNIYRTQLIKFAQEFGSKCEYSNQNLTVVYCIKEKKQKIMRLSKKSKEIENKKETVEGLNRLVCTSRNHSIPLNVYIDDIEYNNIKFLQISSLWQGKSNYINIVLP